MRFENPTISELLSNSEPKRLRIFGEIQFPQTTIRAHTGVGTRTYEGKEYLGVGNLVNISQFKENANRSANRLTVSISHTDQSLFSQVVNDNPIGGEATLHLVKLDEHNQIIGGEVLFSGEIVDYALKKGKPYTISVTLSDWFEVWGLPVENSKFTDASQKHKHPDDDFFNQVEKLAKGIPDTIAGRYVGSPEDRRRTRRGGLEP